MMLAWTHVTLAQEVYVVAKNVLFFTLSLVAKRHPVVLTEWVNLVGAGGD
jgi:hypothetical protein